MLSRWLISTLLLVGLALWLGPARLVAQLSSLDPVWVGVALVIGSAQVFASAWRWRFTARCLGLTLPYGQALREYYLASLINQLMPGGVIGDAYRAKRHSDLADQRSLAWSAVVVERFSGQLVLVGLTVGVLFNAKTWQPLIDARADTAGMLIGLGVGVVALVTSGALVAWVLSHNHLLSRGLRAFGRALQATFWPWPRLAFQVTSSGVIVLAYLGLFVLAAWALGVDRDFAELMVLAPPCLLAMVVPITVSGWGLREATAAASWGLLGLDPAQGVAVSVVYGLLIFLTALPGLLMWRSVADYSRKENSTNNSSST